MLRISSPNVRKILTRKRFLFHSGVALASIPLSYCFMHTFLLFFGIIPHSGMLTVDLMSLIIGPVLTAGVCKLSGPCWKEVIAECRCVLDIVTSSHLYLELNAGEHRDHFESNLVAKSPRGKVKRLRVDNDYAQRVSGSAWSSAETLMRHQRVFSADARNRFKIFADKIEHITDILSSQHRDPLLFEADEAMLQKMHADYAYLLCWLSTLKQTTGNLPGDDFKTRLERARRAVADAKDAREKSRAQENLEMLVSQYNQSQKRGGLLADVNREIETMENRLNFIYDSVSMRSALEPFGERLYMPSPLLDELRRDAQMESRV